MTDTASRPQDRQAQITGQASPVEFGIQEQLRERIKELDCLYAIATLMETTDSLEEILQSCTNIVSNAWLYPEVTCTRIVLPGQLYQTANFRETNWRQSAAIALADQPAGRIDVFYLEERPMRDEGPFLTEERKLINAIAERLGKEIFRKQMEDHLRESEKQYRTLFEQSNDGIFVVDTTTGNYLDANLAAQYLTGRSLSELTTKRTIDITPDGAVNRLEILSDGDGPFDLGEVEYVRPNGTTRTALLSAIRLNNNRIYGIAHDITERKRAEEMLRTNEERLKAVTFSIADWVWEVDENGVYTYSSQRGIDLFGDSRGDIIGKTPFDFMPPDEAKRVAAIFSELVANRAPIKDLENWNISKDGRRICLLTNGVPLLDREGNFKGYRGVDKDITDLKQAEEENRNLQERLQRAEKMESLGMLAGGVAHDLNNVLGVVIGYAEMLMDTVDESSPIRHNLQNIMNGGLRAAAIVDDLVALARRGVQSHTIVSLNNIISDSQRSSELASLCSHHPGVTIRAELETELLNISASPVHLSRSLFNLITNAFDAIPSGGTVTIKTTSQYLDKPVHGYDQIEQGDYAVLSVTDTGEGIPEVDLKRIFEPFYTKKALGRSGSGLGLSVVWSTVKDHKGYIDVQSEAEKGTTFTLYFPVTRADISDGTAAVATEEYLGKGESVLVVDDIKEQRDLAAGMLRTLNYRVSSVASGEEAVAHLRQHQVDLMVLDMIMDPGMDGLDTYKEVIRIRPNQKAIMVSGFAESDRVKAAQELGAGAYARKPYLKEKLGLAVRKELDSKQSSLSL